jgi:ferredoxin
VNADDKRQVAVTIRHQGAEVVHKLRRGLGFQALAVAASTPIEFDCRAADCGICVIRIKEHPEHLSPPTTGERDFLLAMRASPEERLACQCRILGDVTVEVDDYSPGN